MSTAVAQKRLTRRIQELYAADPQFAAARPDAAVSAAIAQPGLRLPQLVQTVMEGYADRPALGARAVQLVKDPDTGRITAELLPRFETITYAQLWARVGAVARALANQPVRPGDRVCILGFGSIDYTTIDLALIKLGAVSVPLRTAPASELQPIVAETRPSVIASSIGQLDEAVELALTGHTPARLVVFDYYPEVDDQREALQAARTRLADAGGLVVAETIGDVVASAKNLPSAPEFSSDEQNPLTLVIYTSGSTGTPKGAMHTEHIVANAWLETTSPMPGNWHPGPHLPTITLNFMPLSHNWGRHILYGTLGSGGIAYFAAKSDLSTLLEDLAMVRPTPLALVPRVWDMLFKEFECEVERLIADGGDRAAAEAQAMADQRQRLLGGRYVTATTGSAPMSSEMMVWVEDYIDMRLTRGYGSTECHGWMVGGEVRRPPVIDYKLVDVPDLGYFHTDRPHPRGEVVLKSELVFAGYYNQPEITAEVFDSDGYYQTGDIFAEVEPDRLQYLGRRNDVLKLSQGEFVTVSKLEAEFENSPLIRQIYIYGNSARAYPLAVIVPAEEALSRYDGEALKPLISESLRDIAKRAGLQPYEIPRDFIIETTPFTLENGLLTDIRKMARPKLKQHYGQHLEQLYTQLADIEANELRELRRNSARLMAQLAGQTAEQQLQTLITLVRTSIATVLAHPDPAALDTDLAFKDLGIDSLTALELRNALTRSTGLTLPATLVFDHPTPTTLAGEIHRQLAQNSVGQDRHPAEPAEVEDFQRLVASIPLERLREEGIFDLLLDVADPKRPGNSNRLKRQNRARPAGIDEPVAVVGMACRFPGGVDSAAGLWDVVVGGIDAVGGFPGDRGWDLEGLFDPDPDAVGKTYTRSGAFLADGAGFDAEFFGISGREARSVDPQQRLLLEVCWEALEGAGIDPAGLVGSDTGVFVGTFSQPYGGGGSDSAEGYALTGRATSVASGRVAYVLGLQGPAITVDTACSSSLVATHLACGSLHSGESSLALAGGVTVMTTPTPFTEFARQRGLAVDGRCKAFSAVADGAGWGEGAGVLVLERLSDARAHGHRVLAVVAGSAVNQDGASNGLTAPNGPAQQRVIRQALANAGLSTADVDVVEAHGTGTRLGDPIEAGALLATYGVGRDGGCPLWLGSVKSNIGHTQAAAGAAGLIKMVEALNHDVLPPTLHVGEPSPHVDWSSGGLRLLTEVVPWPVTEHPRTAGVSSFGISGTNAHVIVQQAPALPAEPIVESAVEPAMESAAVPSVLVWPVSARSSKALADQAHRLHQYLLEHPGVDLADMAYSLAATRSHHPYRAAIVSHCAAEDPRRELLGGLAALSADVPHPRVTRHHRLAHVSRGETVFVLPGQGSQYPGMGLGLYQHHRAFARVFDEVCAAVDQYLEVSLREVMFAEPGSAVGELVHQTAYTQPALFAMGAAMYAVLVDAGITPDYLLGHSIGELTAAYLAGVFSLGDAAALVTARGRLMQACPPGAMVAIEAGERDVLGMLEGHPAVAIAAVNGPTSVVVSGHPDELEPIRDYCAAHHLRAKSLSVSHAFHSSLMDSALAEFEAIAAGLTLSSPTVPVVSNLTGQLATGEQLTSSRYWVRHLREPVRFYDGVGCLLGRGEQIFVELSPHPTLSAAITETLSGTADRAGSAVIPTLHRERSDLDGIAMALGQLHNHGHSPSWRSLYPEARVVGLPTYAFQHRSYWIAPTAPAAVDGGGLADGVLWRAVDDGAVDTVAQVLGMEDAQQGASLGDVVCALRQWRSGLGVRSAANRLRYRVGWQGITPNMFPVSRRRWLVLVLPEQADDAWVTGLSARYPDDVEVRIVDPTELDRNSLSALVATAAAGGCDGVVSFLAIDERSHPGLAGVSVGLLSTLVAAQAHGDAGVGIPLWVITQGGVCVSTDDGVASPGQCAVWGLGQSVCLEYPEQWGGLIDVPSSATPQDVECLYAILACPQSEDQLAIRRHGVSARRVLAAPLAPERLECARSWQPSGTAVVTGATGRLGKHVVGWLAEMGADLVVLLSRNAAEHAQSDELQQALDARGVATVSVSVDVTDRAALAAVVADIRRVHGRIGTVVHAAAAIGWSAIAETSVQEFSDAYAAKAVGADNLVDLFEDDPPDTFIVFSSAAGTWGGARQGCYAAANAHVDASAARLRRKGCGAVSVAFGAWADEAGDVSGDVVDYFERIGINPMPAATALVALQQAVEANDTLITIADVSWDRFLPAFTARRAQPLLTELAAGVASSETISGSATTGNAPGFRDKLAGHTAEQQLDMVTTLVRTSTATVLAHPDPAALDTELAFKDLGIDSLTTLELRNALSAHTGLTMPASVVFDHPTPAAFAKYLTGQLTDTAAVVLGPIGQLVEAALDNEDRTVLVEILIATSRLQSADLDDGASPKDITATDVTVLDDAPVRLVCLAEFAGQYQAFAAGIQGDVQVTEILAPGFSGTSPPATVENAAQAIVDALDARILGSQTLVIAGHGVTCVPALHVVQLLRGQISSTGAQLPRLATVLIGPIATRDARTISADPLLPEAISAHLHSEGDLIAYGRYLRFGMHSPEATQDEGLLAIHPRTGKHVKAPASPLVLEPALTALSISNWIDDLQ